MKRVLLTAVQWIVSLAVLLALWQWWLVPMIGPVFLAAPNEVLVQLGEWWDDGVLLPATWTTFATATVALLLGGTLGVIAALALYWNPTIRQVLEPAVAALYAMPKIALVPLLFIWFGRGATPGVAFVTLSAFPVLFMSTSTGLRTVDQRTVAALARMRASRRQIATKLLVRHTLGYVAVGFAVAGPFALLGVLVVEMLQGTGGLGGLLARSAGFFDAGGVMAAAVVATVIGLLLNGVTNLVERRFDQGRTNT
ncbi:ABC transporter permease [Phytohabitans kaempferiae]|uniref:ABC transporter permease n=1 Tax=Phytohabitans kaempferiae TaxID=1620943 RepID=A0ABV6M7C4_9ACTN